jgi:Mg2+ and Co2+ transporter CorA
MTTRIEIEIQYLQNEIESIKDSIKESLDMNFFNVAHNKVQRIQELTEKIFELRTLLNS